LFKKNQKAESWHCPPCRFLLTKSYCSICVEDKNVLLLVCAECEDVYHTDCVGRVDLGIKGTSRVWSCSKCEPTAINPNPNPTVQFDKAIKSKTGIKFLHLNINSLLKKFEKVQQLLLEHEIHIFGITETKLVRKDPDSDFEVEGYQLVRRDRPALRATRMDNRGGGLALYVHKDFKVREVEGAEDYYKDDQIEYLIVKLSGKEGMPGISVILVYSPQPNNVKLSNRLGELILEAKKYKPQNEVYILGDINIDLLSELRVATTLKEMLLERNFFPLVKEPTRVDRNGAKCIDLIATNCERKIITKSGAVNLKWSDHYLVYGVRK